MRTEQERMELIRKRTLEIRKKEKKRRQRIIDMGCAAACVLLIICLGMLMPQITAQIEGTRMDGVFGGAASIFGTNSAQGYIVMGIICFFIGLPQEKVSLYSSFGANFILFCIIIGFIIAGIHKRINIYDAFIEGAKEGFKTAVTIIPYLVAILDSSPKM